MATELYFGNLDYSIDADELKTLVAENFLVRDCRVIKDKGIGFVRVNDENVDEIIEKFHGAEMKGRNLKVYIAKPDPAKAKKKPFNKKRPFKKNDNQNKNRF